MRIIFSSAMLLLALTAFAQDDKHPLLVSHNRIDGPFGGQHRVEDLQVSASGKVLYLEEETKTLGQQPSHASHESKIDSGEMKQLVEFLNSPGVRSLPKKVPSKSKPIDFFWQASLEIGASTEHKWLALRTFIPS